jgi:hypothetical protein
LEAGKQARGLFQKAHHAMEEARALGPDDTDTIVAIGR